MYFDMVIEGRFADPVNREFRGFLGIKDGRITYLTESRISGRVNISLSSEDFVFPGFIDPVFQGSRKDSVLRGLTTIVESPEMRPESINRERIVEKTRAAERVAPDVRFLGGLGPGNMYAFKRMEELVAGFFITTEKGEGNLRFSGTSEIEEALSCMANQEKPVVIRCADKEGLKTALVLSKKHGIDCTFMLAKDTGLGSLEGNEKVIIPPRTLLEGGFMRDNAMISGMSVEELG